MVVLSISEVVKNKPNSNNRLSACQKNKPQKGKKLGNNFNLFLLTLNMITVHPTEKHM